MALTTTYYNFLIFTWNRYEFAGWLDPCLGKVAKGTELVPTKTELFLILLIMKPISTSLYQNVPSYCEGLRR